MKQKIIIWASVMLLLVVVAFMVIDFFYQPKSSSENPYELKLDKKYEEIIRKELEKPDAPLILVSLDEIKKKETNSGIRIMADYLNFTG